jgi:peptidyl-prolyl cis-trans isomerase C
MVPEFEEAAFSQAIGVIGEPVKSQFGYHIIQVLGHEELPVNASQYNEKRQTAFTEWLTKTREESTVTIFEVWKERVPTAPPSMGQLPQ